MDCGQRPTHTVSGHHLADHEKPMQSNAAFYRLVASLVVQNSSEGLSDDQVTTFLELSSGFEGGHWEETLEQAQRLAREIEALQASFEWEEYVHMPLASAVIVSVDLQNLRLQPARKMSLALGQTLGFRNLTGSKASNCTVCMEIAFCGTEEPGERGIPRGSKLMWQLERLPDGPEETIHWTPAETGFYLISSQVYPFIRGILQVAIEDGPLLEACEQGLSGHEPKSIICNTRLAEDPCDASSPVADGYSVHSDPDYGVLLEGMQSSEDLLENLKDHTCSTLAAPELGISMPEGSSCLYGSLATGSARLRQLVAETRGHSSFSADTAAAAVAAARKPARAVVGYPILPSPGVPHDSRGALMPENAFDRKASSHENASSTDSDAEQYSDIPYEALPSDDEGRFYQPLLAPSPNLKTAENILDDICSTRGEMPDIQPGKDVAVLTSEPLIRPIRLTSGSQPDLRPGWTRSGWQPPETRVKTSEGNGSQASQSESQELYASLHTFQNHKAQGGKHGDTRNFSCGSCGASFFAELNSRRCESRHSLIPKKEMEFRDERRRVARANKLLLEQKQMAKAQASLESSLEAHWNSLAPLDIASILGLDGMPYAEDIIKDYPSKRCPNLKCEYAIAGVGLMKEVERGREALSASSSDGDSYWPAWSRLRQLLQQASENTAFSTLAYSLEPGDLASSISSAHEAALAWLIEKNLISAYHKAREQLAAKAQAELVAEEERSKQTMKEKAGLKKDKKLQKVKKPYPPQSLSTSTPDKEDVVASTQSRGESTCHSDAKVVSQLECVSFPSVSSSSHIDIQLEDASATIHVSERPCSTTQPVPPQQPPRQQGSAHQSRVSISAPQKHTPVPRASATSQQPSEARQAASYIMPKPHSARGGPSSRQGKLASKQTTPGSSSLKPSTEASTVRILYSTQKTAPAASPSVSAPPMQAPPAVPHSAASLPIQAPSVTNPDSTLRQGTASSRLIAGPDLGAATCPSNEASAPSDSSNEVSNSTAAAGSSAEASTRACAAPNATLIDGQTVDSAHVTQSQFIHPVSQPPFHPEINQPYFHPGVPTQPYFAHPPGFHAGSLYCEPSGLGYNVRGPPQPNPMGTAWQYPSGHFVPPHMSMSVPYQRHDHAGGHPTAAHYGYSLGQPYLHQYPPGSFVYGGQPTVAMGYPVVQGIPASPVLPPPAIMGYPQESLGPPSLAALPSLQTIDSSNIDRHHGGSSASNDPVISASRPPHEDPGDAIVATPSADSAVVSYAKHGGRVAGGRNGLRFEESNLQEDHERRAKFNQLLNQAGIQHASSACDSDRGGMTSSLTVEEQHPNQEVKQFDVAAGAAELGSRWKEVQAAMADGDVEYA